jgi:hypothetical protein
MQQDGERAGPLNPYAAPLSLSTSAPAVDDDDDVFVLEEFKPFKTIWLRPRATVRSIIATDPALHVDLLASLWGIGQVLDRASMRNLGDSLPMWGILALAVVLGPLGGLFRLWITSHLVCLSGEWLGGACIRERVKTAIAWSFVPQVVALLLWVPLLLLLGSETFTAESPRLDAQPWLWLPIGTAAMAGLAMTTWSLVLLCHTIAEVQGYRSAWRGLGNLVLAAMVIFVPLLVIGIVMFLFLGSQHS